MTKPALWEAGMSLGAGGGGRGMVRSPGLYMKFSFC